MREKSGVAEIEHGLRFLLEPGAVAELRILHTRCGTVSGYFDDPAKLARAAVEWDGRAPGVYVTLNPVRPELLARSANRLTSHARQTTSDRDILRRRWLPVDFDPVRPSGISSSEAEHAAAVERAYQVREVLAGRGWPEPLVASSGNGAHLLYPLDFPNDEAAHQQVHRALMSLALEFSDAVVRVDTSTHNAARIWKLYGTRACKGDATPDRSHRVARVLEYPQIPIKATALS